MFGSYISPPVHCIPMYLYENIITDLLHCGYVYTLSDECSVRLQNISHPLITRNWFAPWQRPVGRPGRPAQRVRIWSMMGTILYQCYQTRQDVRSLIYATADLRQRALRSLRRAARLAARLRAKEVCTVYRQHHHHHHHHHFVVYLGMRSKPTAVQKLFSPFESCVKATRTLSSQLIIEMHL